MCTVLCGQGDYIILQMLNIIYQKWVNVATFSGCSINEEKNVLSHQLALGILLPTFQLIPTLIFKMDTEIFTVCMVCLFLHQDAHIYCEKNGNVHMIDIKYLSLLEDMDLGGSYIHLTPAI